MNTIFIAPKQFMIKITIFKTIFKNNYKMKNYIISIPRPLKKSYLQWSHSKFYSVQISEYTP